MVDELVRVLLPGSNLKLSVASCTGLCREARQLHQLQPVSAQLLAHGVAGAVLMASLLKDEARVNLQIECDGPLRGLLVDAGAGGDVRGYVKNPNLEVELAHGAFQWRAALGNSGFLSVLRPLPEGEYYRSSVELEAFAIERDLQNYFAKSEQVATRVALSVRRVGDEALGAVAGVLVQALPDGDAAALEAMGARLQQRLDDALDAKPTASVDELLAVALDGAPALHMARTALAWRCTCSKQRVLNTLASLGATEVKAMLEEQGQAEVNCHFCGAKHLATKEDLERLLAGFA